MHEQARPCVFFVSDVCSLRTQNLKLTEEMDHNSKQRKERTTEKYRTNEVQKKHPFLNLQKKKMSFEKKKKQKEASKND
jgi:alpha-D-ribose 1-methylphosphonate 5-triphosphate diphosphatase PhnM